MAASDPASDFLKAASDGDLTLLKRLAPETGNPRGIMDAEGRNALHLAAEAGKTQICKYLVENLKFDVDFRDKQGSTPLLLAVLERHHSTAVYLTENGAGIDSINYSGFNALHYAALKGQKEIMRLLLSKGAKVVVDQSVLNSAIGTPLHWASFYGNEECLHILLDHGADANLVSMLYSTPLMNSILGRSYECMELLLKAGADPNLGYAGRTPLILAACVLDTRFVIHLLKAGANPNVVDSSGVTPLELAALRGSVDAAVMALFSCTSRVSSFPYWSVDGIIKYVWSEEAITQRENKKKKDVDMSKAKGREAVERKDYEDAIVWYTQAIFADPTDATLLSNRSLCWAMLNQAHLALRDANACVALKPDWPKAHYRAGAALMLVHDYSMAAEAFSKALKLDPNNKDLKKAHREAVEAEALVTTP